MSLRLGQMLAGMAALQVTENMGPIVAIDMAEPLGMDKPPDLEQIIKIDIPDLGFSYGGAAPGSRKYAPTHSKHMPHQGTREMHRRLKRLKAAPPPAPGGAG